MEVVERLKSNNFKSKTSNNIEIMRDALYLNLNIPMVNFKNKTSAKNDRLERNRKASSLNNINSVDAPQAPQKFVNYNNYNGKRQWERRDRTRDSHRANSPKKEYDSDESCTSYSSRSTPPVCSMRFTNNNYNNGSKSETFVNKFTPHNNGNIHYVYQHHYNKNRYYSNRQNNAHTNQNNNSNSYNNNNQKMSSYYNHHHRNNNNNNNYNSNNNSNNNNNNNNTNNNYPDINDVMVRRAHGLVERFKSRADLMRVDPHPPELLTGTPLDNLNQAIWDVFSSKAQKEKTYESKISLWKNIFLYFRKCLNSYGLFMVGSTMSGFGLESSDIDMCLLTKPCTNDPRLDSLQHLNSLRHHLIKSGISTDPELILAKVPILKFKDKETGFEIDLNCNNSVGIRNTHLLHCYARLDWRVRPLVVVVKLWAQANGINDAKNMTVSSYSWALMVIHYLQCGVSPAVLPCLHGLIPEKFNSDQEHQTMDVQEDVAAIKNFKSANSNCLGELLIGFLQYYTYFDYSQFAISVRTGARLPIDECRFMKAPKNDPHQWKYLCIEEPFDFTNTARSVFDPDAFRHIRNVICCSFNELATNKVLSNILPVSRELLNQR